MEPGAITTTASSALERPPIPEVLRPQSCPKCDYSLTGLPPRGVCPECGSAYPDRTIILHGWSAGSRASASTAHPRALFAYAFIVAIQLFNALMNGWRAFDRIWTAVAVFFWLAVVGFTVWRRWSSGLPGLIQVHLTEHGARHFENARASTPGPMTSWGKLHELTLEEKRPGEWRFRLQPHGAWWKMITPTVDAVVKCSAEQAATLREQIREWQSTCAPAAGKPAR
jgi:hypothetical protein